MKLTIIFCLLSAFTAVLLAQGPPGGGRDFGPRGFAGRGAGILGAGPGSRTPSRRPGS